MTTPSQLLFLPGASGSSGFWKPLMEQLTNSATKVIVQYPGFGDEPSAPDVNNFDDLVQRVISHIDQPTALIAQSMGGVLAVYAALAKPELVTHIVLSVTSGGIDTNGLDVQDWRNGFLEANPSIPDWFVSFRSDLSEELRGIAQPVLLLWGDADPWSPLAVGRRILALMPNARLHVVSGGGHDLANVHSCALAPIVDAHLMCGPSVSNGGLAP